MPREVPVSVASDQVPGSRWARATSSTSTSGRRRAAGARVHLGLQRASLVRAAVTVLDAPPPDQAFGSEGGRMLVLGVREQDAHRFFRLLATTDDPSLTVVGRG